MRRELQVVLRKVNEIPIDDLPTLLGELEQVRYTAIARLIEPTNPSPPEPDRLMPVEQAASRLGVSKDFLYRHADEYPFTRRIGSSLRFSSVGIDRFIGADSGVESRRKGNKRIPPSRFR